MTGMSDYRSMLCEHLGRYREQRLGIHQMGKWERNGREYAHILPEGLEQLNILEAIRSEMQCYLNEHPDIKLHKDFRHLNSSQAFAFNLFFPYLREGGYAARALSEALGIDAAVSQANWRFEEVQDEGTNVDVVWETTDSARVFCEVKLTEGGFGVADDDDEHRKKHRETYLPRLEGHVSSELLERTAFFSMYQLLRNLSLITGGQQDHLVLLLPRANMALVPQLERFLDGLSGSVRHRVHRAYVEDVVARLESDCGLSPRLQVHAWNLHEKYLPSIAMSVQN